MKIALFGAGKEGIRALHNIGKERVHIFIDNNRTGEIEGIPILNLEQINKSEKEDLLILITSQKYRDEMIAQLNQYGLKNYLTYSDEYSPGDYNKRLSADQWGTIYNESIMEEVMDHISKDVLNVQTQEMIRITKEGEKILEIGCGSGETSLALAKRNRQVTCIDYSKSSIDLVNKLIKKTGYMIETHCIDALAELPFEDQFFDIVFQAGLLEHFEKEQRTEMLQKWKRVCKRMVSLIPNAHCMAYRVGKQLAEENNTWRWGLEMPQSSLKEEFEKAGYINIQEYSVGERHALNFLPKDHYLRVAICKWLDESKNMEDWGQGYLLVTTAINPE